MTNKINSKIVSFKVITNEEVKEPKKPELERMNENLVRPELLLGSTYKIKTPQSEHALYITINDLLLNKGTEDESRHPYEIFINSKNMEEFQWVLALTRVISAVFRKGGDITFMVEELKGVFDPKGGYFKKGGVFMPSLVSEIGLSIESHMKMIGLIKKEPMDEGRKKFIEEKRKQALEKEQSKSDSQSSNEFPASATVCPDPSCSVKSVVIMDGCGVCLSCGNSKCN